MARRPAPARPGTRPVNSGSFMSLLEAGWPRPGSLRLDTCALRRCTSTRSDRRIVDVQTAALASLSWISSLAPGAVAGFHVVHAPAAAPYADSVSVRPSSTWSSGPGVVAVRVLASRTCASDASTRSWRGRVVELQRERGPGVRVGITKRLGVSTLVNVNWFWIVKLPPVVSGWRKADVPAPTLCVRRAGPTGLVTGHRWAVGLFHCRL